jgi:hypothetical protein
MLFVIMRHVIAAASKRPSIGWLTRNTATRAPKLNWCAIAAGKADLEDYVSRSPPMPRHRGRPACVGTAHTSSM